jgi:subtilisin family serine protease
MDHGIRRVSLWNQYESYVSKCAGDSQKMNSLDLVRMRPLMLRGQGIPAVTVALIDGPIILNHPDLAGASIREIPGKLRGACIRSDTMACTHGTFVAGILFAQRGSSAPAICPGCTLLLRPIFGEEGATGHTPSTTPGELAEAIVDSVDAGAKVINLSSAMARPSLKAESRLEEVLNYAAQRNVIIVAAAGNEGTVGSSALTRHPWVIPVAACNAEGQPLRDSNIGGSIGRKGLRAPGQNITSLGTNREPLILGGTSAAAPFVTGAIALLWSEFPNASASEVRLATTLAGQLPRKAIVPPLLDAEAAYRMMVSISRPEERR